MTEPPQDAYHRAGGEPADDQDNVSRLDRFLDPANLKRLRSISLFLVGLGGVVYEVTVDGTDRPTLLVLLAAMMGLPAFLGTDEKRRRPPDPPPPDGGTP